MARPTPPRIRGIDHKTELPQGGQDRDVRPFGQRIAAGLRKKANLTAILSCMALFCFILPGYAFYVFITALFLAFYGLTRLEVVPLKIPVQAQILDANELHPKDNTPVLGAGIFFMGADIVNGKEIWLTNDDCRQHFLILGTTGAGKALRASAPVLTPGGWRPISELQPGDVVITPSGDTAEVEGVYPQGAKPIAQVGFEDGRTASPSTDHLWTVWVNGAHHTTTLDTTAIAGLIESGHTLEIPLSCVLRDEQAFLARQNLLRLVETAPQTDTSADIVVLNVPLDQSERVLDDIRALGGMTLDTRDGEQATRYVIPRWVLSPSPNHRPRRLKVTHVDLKAGHDEAVCIRIDHPDHLFVTEDYIATHNTEILLSFAANALSWGSGFLFVDGKGDISLFAKVWVMCRRWGREDDILVLNFMTGNKASHGPSGRLNSNTLNPFATGAADNLVQLVVSLMSSSGGGNGDMWKGRATTMFTGLMYALVWMRDNGLMQMGVSEIRDFLQLRQIMNLAKEENYPDMPVSIRKAVKAYLSSLAGYKEEAGEKQAASVGEQHGYLEMQFTQIFSSLVDVYSHVFNVQYGEIDMFDLVLNRRILVVMLPALEKEQSELANLGKIVVASLKGMMGAVLGHELEGNWDDIVENRPTSSPSPFMCIFDECGYYTVTGMALMAAQARSLGFSLVFASQDLNAMKRLEEKEADSIIANCNTKALMRTEDKATGQLAVDAGGKDMRIQNQGYQRQQGEFGSGWQENDGVNYQHSERIDFLDLKGQNAGYLHLIYKDKVIRARSFYADAPSSLDKSKVKLRPNHFITVARPSLGELDSARRAPEIAARFIDEDFPAFMREQAELMCEESATSGSSINLVANILTRAAQVDRPPVERSCIALAEIIVNASASAEEFTHSVRTARTRRAAPDPFANPFADPLLAEDPDERPFSTSRPKSSKDIDDEFEGVPFKSEHVSKPRLDDDVEHKVSVDDIDVDILGDDILSDDVLGAFEALNFDEQDAAVSTQTVNDKLDAAMNPEGTTPANRSVVDVTAASMQTKVDTKQNDAGDGGDGGDGKSEEEALYENFLELIIQENQDDG